MTAQSFITKTYVHLAGAIAAFVGIEAFLLMLPGTDGLAELHDGQPDELAGGDGGLHGGQLDRQKWAMSDTSIGMQYLGLGLYVVAQAVIFLPLMLIARQFDASVIPTAGLITAILFASMTMIVFVTRKDFSFLRSILMFGGFAAIGLIVVGAVFGFNLGNIFVVAMIALACGYILYDTSNVLLHYRIGQHVAASLALFASVALMFWYVLQLVMSLNRR